MESPEVAFKKALDDAELALERVVRFIDGSDLSALEDVIIAWGLYRYAMGTAAGLQYIERLSWENLATFVERMERIHRYGHDTVSTKLGQYLLRLEAKYEPR